MNHSWGFIGIGSVHFDIDIGQKVEIFYPNELILNKSMESTLASLSLPQSNNFSEGDTPYTIRIRINTDIQLFKKDIDQHEFYYGFVLFRQRKDSNYPRGYYQKSIVLLSKKPFINIYEKVLRIVGPLFFKIGPSILEPIYDNIKNWQNPVEGSCMKLPVAGTFIKCNIPIIEPIMDNTFLKKSIKSSPKKSLSMKSNFSIESNIKKGPLTVLNETVDNNKTIKDIKMKEKKIKDEDDNNEMLINENIQEEKLGKDEKDEKDENIQEITSYNEKKNIYHHSVSLPSLDEVLEKNPIGYGGYFQSLGLYSSFYGMEAYLWSLWQLAILGENLLIYSPNPRICSQATLAFISLISPIEFNGDYRPYFTLFEPDFQDLIKRHDTGKEQIPCTILGCTNPYFLKSFRMLNNILYLPEENIGRIKRKSPVKTRKSSANNLFGSTTSFNNLFFISENKKSISAPNSPDKIGSMMKKNENTLYSTSSKKFRKIGKNKSLEQYQELFEEEETTPKLLTRRSTLILPDATIMKQLVPSSSNFSSINEDPATLINNALLREHFFYLTKQFLSPFEKYFSLSKLQMTSLLNPYVEDVEKSFMKDFNKEIFLKNISIYDAPSQIHPFKWKKLYKRFMDSPHFILWFKKNRQNTKDNFEKILRHMRANTDIMSIVNSIQERQNIKLFKIKNKSSLPQTIQILQEQIQNAIKKEKEREICDKQLLIVMQGHFEIIQKLIDKK